MGTCIKLYLESPLLGGKQITEFEKKTIEQTRTDYKLEIERQVEAILKNEPSWPQLFSEYVTNKINAGIDKGLNDIYWANLRADIAVANDDNPTSTPTM